MKYLLSLILIAFLVSCSTTKYSYRFPASPSLQAEKIKKTDVPDQTLAESSEKLVASSNQELALILSDPAADQKEKARDFPSVSKTLKAFKRTAQNTRDEIRSVVVPDPASLDDDLKLAILFGVVGFVSLVLLILSKLFGIIGGIALIIATVYFVKWFLAQ